MAKVRVCIFFVIAGIRCGAALSRIGLLFPDKIRCFSSDFGLPFFVGARQSGHAAVSVAKLASVFLSQDVNRFLFYERRLLIALFDKMISCGTTGFFLEYGASGACLLPRMCLCALVFLGCTCFGRCLLSYLVVLIPELKERSTILSRYSSSAIAK